MKSEFIMMHYDNAKIHITDFKVTMTFYTDLKFNEGDHDGHFGLSIELNSNNLVNITPHEKDDPYEANIGINTEYLGLYLDKLKKPIAVRDLNFSIQEKRDESDELAYEITDGWEDVIDTEEGVGNYYVDSYFEMENWHLRLSPEESSNHLRLQISANDYYDKHIGFHVDVPVAPTQMEIFVRGAQGDTQESLTSFIKTYFSLDDLDISFEEYETIEGFKKEKKIFYNLKASFK